MAETFLVPGLDDGVGPGGDGGIFYEDASSYLLLEDGSSFALLE